MSVSLVERAAQLDDEILQILDGMVDVFALVAERSDPLLAAVDRHPALGFAMVAEIIEVELFADLGEAEADPLAAQYPGEPGAVAPRIDPGEACALRRDQPFVLVEAKRSGGDTELLAQFGDGIGPALARLVIIGVERGLRHGRTVSLR